MRIMVNDSSVELPSGATVADLVGLLAAPQARVAIEVNRQLIRRADHAATLLHDGDTIEMVTLVGGG